jgi:hypothetical protein
MVEAGVVDAVGVPGHFDFDVHVELDGMAFPAKLLKTKKVMPKTQVASRSGFL